MFKTMKNAYNDLSFRYRRKNAELDYYAKNFDIKSFNRDNVDLIIVAIFMSIMAFIWNEELWQQVYIIIAIALFMSYIYFLMTANWFGWYLKVRAKYGEPLNFKPLKFK